MDKKPPFRMAQEKPAAEILRGDVIMFNDLKTNQWQRGIVYNPIHNETGEKLIGFRLLPLDTPGKNIKTVMPYPSLEKHVSDIVQKAGGNERLHKTVVTFNMRTVANINKMTGLNNGTVWSLGSYQGSPYMVELLSKVEELYNAGQLYMDGRKIQPETRVVIVPPAAAERDAKDNSRARRKAYKTLEEDREKGRETLAVKLKPVTALHAPLEELIGDTLSENSVVFLRRATLKDGTNVTTLAQAREAIETQRQALSRYCRRSQTDGCQAYGPRTFRPGLIKRSDADIHEAWIS
jgi:hypothetical protein